MPPGSTRGVRGRLHVAGFNTGSNPLAVACAGFRPFAMMAREDGSFGDEMEIITYPGSGIEKIEDVKDRTLAFTSETSNSGFKAPSALLKAQYGMEAGTDSTPAFLGAHDNSILGMLNKDYDAAAITNSGRKRMVPREVIKQDQYQILFTSQTFPTSAYGVAHNLTPEVQATISEAFFSFDWTGTTVKTEVQNSGEAQFIPITFKEYWSVIREIDVAQSVEHICN